MKRSTVHRKQMMKMRIGEGWDTHQLVTGRPLILGGIAIPHTHVDDAFAGATCRAEQVVHHGQLQQFADIGLILDGRHFGDGLVQCLGEQLQKFRPLNTANAAGRRRVERCKTNRNRRVAQQHTVEVDRGGLQI